MSPKKRSPSDAAQRADAQLAAIVLASDDAITSTDLDGTIITWNRGAELLYGYRPDEVIGQNVSILFPEGEVSTLASTLGRARRGEVAPPVEGRRRRRDGTEISVAVRISPIIGPDGVPVGISAVSRDVTERDRKEAELVESRDFLERTQEIAHIGSWRSDVGLESEMHLSAECRRILGLDPDRVLLNRDFYRLINPEDAERFIERFMREQSRADLEFRIVRPDGTQRWVLVVADALLDESGSKVSVSGVMQDITNRKEIEESLARDALYDRLTGLPNRSLFLDRAGRALARATASHGVLTVFFVDLDRFKFWNDTYGHDRGNQLLQEVANRLRALVPATDTVARFSADEFVVALEGMSDSADAAQEAERILERLREPVAGDEAVLTASIGITLGPSGANADSLVRDAELAMHHAKLDGGNRYELYDLALRQQADHRLTFESRLRHALDEGDLFLEYQPVASLETDRFVGAEALIRWRGIDEEVIAPENFIDVAEETGLIVPIGAWVIETACRQLRTWLDTTPEAAAWSIAINISAAQLRDPGFRGVIERAISGAGIPGSAVVFELTESLLVEGAVTEAILRSVRELGPRFSIDDFGTGYSSLAYLRRLPVDELKIDQSFVARLVEDESDRAVVTAIVALGGALKLRVTAEGVESEAQLAIVRALGCDAAQGFFLSQPVSAEESATVLRGGI